MGLLEAPYRIAELATGFAKTALRSSQACFPRVNNRQMLEKVVSRTGAVIERVSQHPAARFVLRLDSAAVFQHLAVLGAFSFVGTLLFWPIFGSDYPPGVDTATFLHLSWVTKLALSGQLANPFLDPYWYGGFPYLAAYPPLGYGLVGIISFVTRLDFVIVYTVLLVIAYGGLAAAVYWLATELGLRRWTAALAGLLTALAYPVLSAIFLWGWFTSILALPLSLASLILLERSMRTGSRKSAVWGGVCMALSMLVHHMTGISLGLGMVGWFLYHIASGIYPRTRVIMLSGLFVGVTALIVLPWGIPFLIHTLDVGFRREVAGLWLPNLTLYRNHIVDSSLIGEYIYPSYLGITLMVLATGGTVYALVERRRLAGVAIVLLVLAWFSLGAELNPLIRVYPFSGLDVARFHLYMAPLMALLGGVAVERTFSIARELWPNVPRRLCYGLAVAALAAILVFPVMDAWKARGHMEPYRVKGTVEEAVQWLERQSEFEGEDPSPIFTMGLWNWHSFLIPLLADRPLIDGWHDEGASNVRQIRQLRMMSWTGNVDAEKAHEILSEQGARYVLVNLMSGYRAEASDVFWEKLEARPELFSKEEQWRDVAVFRVLP